MTPKDVLKNTIDTGQMILTTYVSDMSDDDLMCRPVKGMNHIAWQLGHLIASEHKMLSDAGYQAADLPDGFAESHTPETATSDDASKFCKKDEYLALFDKQRAATFAVLNALSDGDLDKPAPEAMRAYAPTVAAVFNLMGLHLVMHGAQFVAVRRLKDKPVLI